MLKMLFFKTYIIEVVFSLLMKFHIVRLTILNSLRQIKEMKHENLVQFFGVCIEPPNVCLVTQYCRKGSLKVSVSACTACTHTSTSFHIMVLNCYNLLQPFLNSHALCYVYPLPFVILYTQCFVQLTINA